MHDSFGAGGKGGGVVAEGGAAAEGLDGVELDGGGVDEDGEDTLHRIIISPPLQEYST